MIGVSLGVTLMLCDIAESKWMPSWFDADDSTEEWWTPGEVIPIDSKETFFDKVASKRTHHVKGETPWFIKFYSPVCPHCQKFAWTWWSFCITHEDDVRVAEVDCTTEEGKPLCSYFNIKSVPTVLYFPIHSNKYY